MTDISLWASIVGLFGPLILVMPLDFMYVDPPTGRGSAVVVTTTFLRDGRYIIAGIDSWVICPPTKGHPPPAVTPKFKRDDRYIDMGINFGDIWAADFNNAIRQECYENVLCA
mgnify:CR=1 FL=1